MHIHSVVEECEIVELLQQIDPKTKKPMKKKVLFVKNGAVVVSRVQVFGSAFFSFSFYTSLSVACFLEELDCSCA